MEIPLAGGAAERRLVLAPARELAAHLSDRDRRQRLLSSLYELLHPLVRQP